MKKVISLFLSLMMLLSITAGLDLSAYARTYSGQCGDNATWSYNDDTKKLTITGSGAMYDYASESNVPWASYSASATLLDISNEITSIGGYAFYNCSKISNVKIPSSLVSIGNNAFSGCSGITRVNIGSVEQWFNITFWSRTSNPLVYGKYLYLNDSPITELTIPDTFTSIGGYTLSGYSGLKTITIPNSVTNIGNSAFYGCTGLTSVTVPDSVTRIGDDAFNNCTSLTGITIGNSVTSIGDKAFYNCTSLTNVTIPDSVTSIGDEAFEFCKKLKDIILGTGLQSLGKNAFNTESNNRRNIHIKSISSFCELSIYDEYSLCLYQCDLYYDGNLITNLMIPEGVEYISSQIFERCSCITSVTIPNSVKNIGNKAFYGCTGLTSVTIGNSVTSIGSYVFYGCTGLTSVTIGNSVTSIGSYAFSDCTGLIRLTIPCAVDIGSNSFYGIRTIEEINITKSVNSTEINYSREPWGNSRTTIQSLIIEDGVTSIPDNTFQNFTSLNDIELPSSIKSIGSNAFYNTAYFNNSDNWKNNALYIGKDLISVSTKADGQFTVKPRTVTIADNAFNNCNQITNVVLPESVVNIGNSAFNGCSSLTQITIPDSIENIGDSILTDCSSLKNITVPSSLDYNNNAITNCSGIERINLIKGSGEIPSYTGSTYANTPWYKSKNNLSELILEEGIKKIGAYAFYNNAINSITLPSSLTEVGRRAFENCENLETVYFCGSEEEWNNINFNEDNEYLTSANIIFNYIIPCREHTKVIVSPAVEPTCTSVGYTEDSYCSVCNHVISARTEIPKLEHISETDEAVEPTCTKTGLTEGSHCSVCGAVLTAQEVINAKGHSYESVVTAPTCKDQGYTTYTCKDCGDSYKADFTTVTDNHDYKGAITTPATCNADGVKTFTCSICGDTYTEVIEKTGEHNYESVVTKPSTCTERGVTTYTCSVCGDKYISYISMKSHSAVTDAAVAPTCTKTGLTKGSHCRDCGAVITAQEVVNAKGHSYTSVVTAPTCKEQGYTTYTCSVCGDSYKGDFTAVTTNHDYKSTVTTPATCTAKGVKTFTCSICGDKYTEDIDMLAHSAVTDKAVAATCTKTGLTEGSHCSVCGAVIVEQTVIPAKQHNYVPVVTAPTCRDKGYTTYTCSACGDSYRADYTDKLTTHDYSSAVTKLPTCSAEGVKTFTCSVCGDTYTEPVEKIAHTPATDAAVAPTGTSTGLTEGSHCSVCGEILVAQQVVPALIPEGASVAVNGDKAVITLSDGSTITVPKDTKETVKNADGTYTVTLNDDSSVTVSSNTEIAKTDDGQLNVKANDNGKTTTVTVPSGSSVVKDGDNYKIIVVNGTETVEKTVAAGETVVIDKSGSMSCNGNHKYDKGVITIAPSYVAEGVKTYTCTVCGNQKIEKLAKLPKKANTLSVAGKTVKIKLKKLKKKNQTVAASKAITVSKAQGTATYAKAKGHKNITVAKNGKITVKKGLKKGTYKVNIKVTAAGNSSYKAASKTVTVTIKVK